MLPKHLRGLSQQRAENIKHSNSLTRIPACLSMPRRSCQRSIPKVLKCSDKGVELKFRYLQYVPQLGKVGDIESAGKNEKKGEGGIRLGRHGRVKGMEGQKKE